MALPDFLIVGAMKAGTTTLFDDLCAHPDVFGPADKEPGNLCRDEVLTEAGRRVYEHLFDRAQSRRCFEASTYYTMQPEYTGAADRAKKLLGADLRVVYLVREPVARAVSHHLHALNANDTYPDLDEAVRTDDRLIGYSRYATQIGPWVSALGEDRVCVVQFEHYIAHRASTVGLVHEFLGLNIKPDTVEGARASNAASDKRVHTGLSKKIANSGLYRGVVRPLLPAGLKRKLGGAVMKGARSDAAVPSEATVEHIIDQTAEESAHIARLVRTPVTGSGVLWDADEVRAKWSKKRAEATQ